MVVGLEKKVVFREGNCHGNRKLRADSAKHFARAILRRNWIQTWLNLANDSISSKVIRTQTAQFLELFIRTLNFFAPLRCENIIVYYCLTERTTSFALDARVLLLHSYDKLSHIFSCILLIRNQNIYLVQFGIHKHSSIISKTTNCNFVSLRKLDECIFIPNVAVLEITGVFYSLLSSVSSTIWGKRVVHRTISHTHNSYK